MDGIKALVSKLTLKEKCSLVSGFDSWHTQPVERLEIPSVMMTDGPHGLRKMDENKKTASATCFPSGAALASSWDRELLEKIGAAIGEEAQAEKISIVLGPACNIKRSPLCGRNFEYFSEDPYLSGQMAKHHVLGVQSQGVGTSLKHFCANNQETMRMRIDEQIDERTLREIYLSGFETAVKEAEPATVMCSYNSVNGMPLACSKRLLTDVLRHEWGFDGFVMTDWGAIKERAECVAAGLDLEMPGCNGVFNDEIENAVQGGALAIEKLDRAVERVLTFVFGAVKRQKEGVSYSVEEHDRLAREAAADCMVLLKNKESVLPLKKEDKVLFVGGFAETPRYQGGGSSHIQPLRTTSLLDALKERGIVFSYSKGFSAKSDEIDEKLEAKALAAAKTADKVVVMAGLPDFYESEGYDRTHLRLPPNQNRLIELLAGVCSNIIVVLSNGAPVEMPWEPLADGILEGYLGGQASGGAVCDILYGDKNPSGRLAETFPLRLEDNPSYLNFPGAQGRVDYREGIYTGYRYYDKKKIPVLYPFGHGLSYTSFSYDCLKLDEEEFEEEDVLILTCRITNTGDRAGAEVAQLYIAAPGIQADRAPKELKGFSKVFLNPGESKIVTFRLDSRSFAYYNVSEKGWFCEPGFHRILVGSTPADIRLEQKIMVRPGRVPRLKVSPYMTVREVLEHPEAKKEISFFVDRYTAKERINDQDGALNPQMIDAMFREMPLKTLTVLYPELFSQDDLETLLKRLEPYGV